MDAQRTELYPSRMRLLVTGSSGWLGRHLVPMLRGAGHSVVGLDIAPGARTDVVGSITDRPLIERVLGEHGIEAIVHAGALHKPDIVRYSSQAFVEVNIAGTLTLLEAAVAAGHDRFVFTSTTSLMITQTIRDGVGQAAEWLDEQSGPLTPRNIYGVTKLAAEGMCRLHHIEHGLSCIVLRTSRFFAEDDDTHSKPSGTNLKANEFLNRRLTVEDAARAHIMAIERAPEIGFDLFLISAPTPFVRDDKEALKRDARSVIARYFPDAPALYAERGWTLPASVDRVYDSRRAERLLGFRCETDFTTVLNALRTHRALPFAHDPAYVSPQQRER